MTTTSCDIFCRVVDNHGDIGICWRLARQLHDEHGWNVRLVVDDLQAFAFIAPSVDADRDRQRIDGIEVHAWREPIERAPARVVIEAFACDPPAAYVEAMATLAIKPLWINLDYLATEPWAIDCQWMTSPHPRLPLLKHFVFPGFEGRLAVLMETDLQARREAALADPGWRRSRLEALGADPDADGTVFVFSYPTPALEALFDAMQAASSSSQLLLAPTAANRALVARRTGGPVRLILLEPVAQSGFDDWLWLADLNFVRGEDSFVRAQLAGAPFVWQAYPQADAAHWDKIESFAASLRRHAAAQQMTAAVEHWWALQQAWNRDETDGDAWGALWQSFVDHRLDMAALTAGWRSRLLARPDLAGEIAAFVAARL
ncbi:elongation factor P maturation arginine rhamnosyltransferase EarP [soil metagenome]